MSESLHDLMDVVRRHLGGDWFAQHGLVQFHHSLACAAADVVEDAEAAIQVFLGEERPPGHGHGYIYVYGVMQAAYMQQDCASTLRQMFGLEHQHLPPGMNAIRELRNRAAGHPSELPRGAGKKPRPATFMARFSVEGGPLQVTMADDQGEYISATYDLHALLEGHRADVLTWIRELAEFLRATEREHRRAIAEAGMASDLLHPSWRYLLSKVSEAANDGTRGAALWAQAGLPSLLKMLGDVESGLAERGLAPIAPHHMATARGALERLGGLLLRLADGEPVALDVHAFRALAERECKHIADVLRDVDRALREPV